MSSAFSKDSFFDDEPISSKREDIHGIAELKSEQLEIPPFEVSSHLPAVSSDFVYDMSTIEEESRSYERSTASASHSRQSVRVHDHVASGGEDYLQSTRTDGLNIDETLNELQQFVNETESTHNQEFDDQQRVSIPYSSTVVVVNNEKRVCEHVPLKSKNSSLSVDRMDTLLRKVDTLESAQNILEQVYNAGVTGEIHVNAINALSLVDQAVLNTENGHDVSRSFDSEIASIQKIVDGEWGSSCSVSSDVTGGNNLLSTSDVIVVPTSATSERAVDEVLREYEDFEKSLSRASITDESFRSDMSLPQLSSYLRNPEDTINSAPIFKAPVLKSTISPSILGTSTTHFTTATTVSSSQTKMVPMPTRAIRCPPDSSHAKKNTCTKPLKSVDNSSVNNKIGEPKPSSGFESTRAEVPQTTSRVKSNAVPSSANARPTISATTTTYSAKELNQEAFKPRNRKSMRSPRTMISPRHTSTEAFMELAKKSSRIGASGDGYQTVNSVSNFQEKSEYAVAEALKTIDKLNAMVARQETLLEAYSTDNEKLWTQLKETKGQPRSLLDCDSNHERVALLQEVQLQAGAEKLELNDVSSCPKPQPEVTESQEKEDKFQSVVDSLQTEVAKLKLNRLVSSSTANSPRHAEIQKLREDAEFKNQQLKDLHKEILMLQSKLTEVRSPVKSKQPVIAIPLQDKEREYQKNIQALNKQVRTLQNILYSKDQTAPPPRQPNSNSQTNKSRPLERTKSDVTKHNASFHQQVMIKSVKCTGVDAKGIFKRRPVTSSEININTGGILQASLTCLEQEREEFENIIAGKNRLIFEKERMILQLKEDVETLRGQLPVGEVVDNGFIDELRSRVITQNKVIQTLKEHLSSHKKMQAENILLREEKSILEQQILDLRRKLELTQNLGKPENEVLSILSEKVEELNSRYYHRERQLDTLLNRLTLKTTTGGNSIMTYLSPLRVSSGQFSNNDDSHEGALSRGRSNTEMYSSDPLNMAEFSPTTSFQLFNAVSDKPYM